MRPVPLAVKSDPNHPLRPTVPTTLLLAVACLAGCAGRATIHVIPADYDRISTVRDLNEVYHPAHACFWVNARDELCLAFSTHPALEPDARPAESFDLSFVLEGQPAGPARNYLADRRTMRALIQKRIGRYRYGSLKGIVAVWFDQHDPDLLMGRFRILANEQDHTWWRGWAGNRQVLFVGRFQAVRDVINGRAMLDRTEAGALKRPPRIGKPVPVTGPPLPNMPETHHDSR
ncbi:MAG: hypothetical protein ACE5GE_14920 [Phycisphaerae bacterium]